MAKSHRFSIKQKIAHPFPIIDITMNGVAHVLTFKDVFSEFRGRALAFCMSVSTPQFEILEIIMNN